MDEQPVVEDGRREEAHVRLEHERLDPLVAQPLVAAGELLEELDARHLEPDEVVRVVRDALRVGLGEAHADSARRSRSPPRRQLCQSDELELRVIGEPGDADADQPQRAGPVAERAVEQRAGELADPLAVVGARRRATSSGCGSRSRGSGASS